MEIPKYIQLNTKIPNGTETINGTRTSGYEKIHNKALSVNN